MFLIPNQLMLPMKWGCVDVARQADAQIISVVLGYDWERNICRVRFGAPIANGDLENKVDAICSLRNSMATLLWDFISEQPPLHREETDVEQLKKKTHRAFDEYPSMVWEYERSCIYQPYPSIEEVFSYLDKLTPCRENAFLFRK